MTRFLSRRYTVVFVDRTSGVRRRVTVPLGWTLATVAFVIMLPVLVGLGIRWATVAEIASLRSNTVSLGMENTHFKAATAELATQITALQGVIDALAVRAKLDPASARAMQQLPAVIKDRAMGGPPTAAQGSALMAGTLASTEDPFGMLRDVLGRLESRLRIVRTDVERRAALAAATPSILPTIGWISAEFGERADPFTGGRAYHPGLDISADMGSAVRATAGGVVESAEWSGSYGNFLVLDHGFGIKTRYGHLSGFAVRAGATVQRGDLVGYVGATGRATGPHLHFEIMANGQLINPLGVIAPR